MRLVRLDPAPAFAGFGVLTPAGEGAACLFGASGLGTAGPGTPVPGAIALAAGAATPGAGRERLAARRTSVAIDLPSLCDEPADRFRRMDRYGALGYAAAHRALSAAGLVPATEPPAGGAGADGDGADAGWGVMIGSSLGCWGSNVQHHRAVGEGPSPDLSPAVFVRTIANAINGDLSIRWRFGGPGETFVSGWTAGAEALAAGGSALASGRARFIMAGGVEAPDPVLRAMSHRGEERDAGFSGDSLAEAAAVAVLGVGGQSEPSGALRLRAFGRGHDPLGRWSLAAALDLLGPIEVGTVIVANTIRTELLARFTAEAGTRELVYLPAVAGELGAAGSVVAAALAAELTQPEARPSGGRTAVGRSGGVLVIARDLEGGTVALALGRCA